MRRDSSSYPGGPTRCRWSSVPFIIPLLARAERYSVSVMLQVSLCAGPDQMRWALMFGGGLSHSSDSDPISDPVFPRAQGSVLSNTPGLSEGRDSDPRTNSGQQQMPGNIKSVTSRFRAPYYPGHTRRNSNVASGVSYRVRSPFVRVTLDQGHTMDARNSCRDRFG